MNSVRLNLESTAAQAMLNDLAALQDRLPAQLANLILDQPQLLVQFGGVERDRSAASGADVLALSLEPTDLALRLVAALRARDGDLDVIGAEIVLAAHAFHLSAESAGRASEAAS